MAKSNQSERAHALLSASSASRWLACPPSAVAAAAYPEQDTAFTVEGTVAHAVAEKLARFHLLHDGDGVVPTSTPEEVEMRSHALEYVEYIRSLIASESDVVLLEARVDFSQWVPGGFGTADCIIVGSDRITIVDYKYGQGVPVSAVGNPQMVLYALGAVSLLGDLYDFHRVDMHIFQPRLDNISAYVDIDVAELLAVAENEIKPAAALAAEGKGNYNPGRHCRFCPHAGKCRGLARQCTLAVKTDGKTRKVECLAPFEVAEVLELEPVITAWLKAVKAQALTEMLDGRMDVPGYKVVEGRLGPRKWKDTDAEVAAALAMDAAGISDDAYLKRELKSPAELDKLLGKKRAQELLGDFVTRAPGAPTIAKDTDKRPAYSRLAEVQNDFKGE